MRIGFFDPYNYEEAFKLIQTWAPTIYHPLTLLNSPDFMTYLFVRPTLFNLCKRILNCFNYEFFGVLKTHLENILRQKFYHVSRTTIGPNYMKNFDFSPYATYLRFGSRSQWTLSIWPGLAATLENHGRI